MDESMERFYKSPEGYEALRNWYDSLVSRFQFDHESEFIHTRFGKTHAIVAGDPAARPLLLVQGLAGSAPLWYHQIPAFAEKFRVYALDTPGQPGRSDLNPPSFTQDGYSQWLLDVMDSLEVEKACFAGVSTGGWFLTRLALRAPHRVEKMILVSPTGLIRARIPVKIWLKNFLNKRKGGQLALEKDLNSRDYFPGNEGQRFDRELAKAMALSTRHFRLQRSVGVVHERSGKIDPVKAIRFTRRMFFSEPVKVLRQVTTDGLVVMGDHEVLYNPLKLQRKLNRCIPSFKVEIIPDSGHSIVFDRPEIFNRLALDYLR